MAITFAVRGNSFDARYSLGPATHTKFNSGLISTASEGLSSTVWDLTNIGGGTKSVSYSAYKNMPNGRTFSILMRIAPSYTGTPAGSRAFFALGIGGSTGGPYMEFRHDVTTGNLTLVGRNEVNTSMFSSNFGAWSPTSGTYYDIVVQWDGTTTSNAVKCYIDASLQGQQTAAAAMSASWADTWWKALIIGTSPNITACAYKLDEFVVWDSLIDTTSVGLVSGTGSLNGASRTSLVDVTASDGSSYSDPGIANVKTGTSYTYAGASQTGTYTGSDRWSDPGVINVLSGVAYKADSTTNNKTGTLVAPTAAEIADAVWDESTSAHATSGTFGAFIQKLLTVAKFLGLK